MTTTTLATLFKEQRIIHSIFGFLQHRNNKNNSVRESTTNLDEHESCDSDEETFEIGQHSFNLCQVSKDLHSVILENLRKLCVYRNVDSSSISYSSAALSSLLFATPSVNRLSFSLHLIGDWRLTFQWVNIKQQRLLNCATELVKVMAHETKAFDTIHHEQVQAFLDHVPIMDCLESITFKRNRRTPMKIDFSFTNRCKALRQLALHKITKSSNVDMISCCTALETLDLHQSDLSSCDLSSFDNLSILLHLNLSSTHLTSLPSFSQSNQLETLDLSHIDCEELNLSALSNLSSVTTLDLSHIDCVDELNLSVLGNLSSVTRLNLSHSNVSDISSLASFCSLEALDLTSTMVSDVGVLGKLRSLHTLTLTRSKVVDVSGLGSSSSLKHLFLNDTDVADVAGLGTVTTLETLDLFPTRVRNVSELSSLVSLRIFKLAFRGHIQEQLNCASLKNFKLLEEVRLGHSFSSTDHSVYRELKSLKVLNFSNHRTLSDIAWIENLTELRQVSLSDTNVSNIKPLWKLTKLNKLSVGRKVSDISVIRDLTQIQYLDLFFTEVEDITALARLTCIEELNLEKTYVTDITPLKSLTSLKVLRLARTKVSDATPLVELTELQYLDLSRTLISNIDILGGLTELRTFFIGLQVTDISVVRNYSKLQVLMLGGTHVKELPVFDKLTSLRYLSLLDTGVTDLSPLRDVPSLPILVVLRKDGRMVRNLPLYFEATSDDVKELFVD